MARSRHRLVLSEDGVAELFRNGEQVWASDSDEDLADALGSRALNVEIDDLADVLDYLVKERYLSDYEADRCEVDTPYDDDEDEDEDEDYDEDEDEDEDEELAE